MLKKVLVILVVLIAIGLMAGCRAPLNLYHNDKLYQEENLEELLEDKLEQENGIDLEVDIYEEVEE